MCSIVEIVTSMSIGVHDDQKGGATGTAQWQAAHRSTPAVRSLLTGMLAALPFPLHSLGCST